MTKTKIPDYRAKDVKVFSTALNQFGLAANEAKRVTNILRDEIIKAQIIEACYQHNIPMETVGVTIKKNQEAICIINGTVRFREPNSKLLLQEIQKHKILKLNPSK